MKEKIFADLSGIKVEKKVDLKGLTTWGVGGPAEYLVKVENYDILPKLFERLLENDIPYSIIGKGSNILASDKGFEGVIIRLGETGEFSLENSTIRLLGGGALGTLLTKLAKRGIKGLEFLAGIPGTVGGAIYINAGAVGKEVKDILEKVTVLELPNLSFRTYDIKEIFMGYRETTFRQDKGKYIIVEGVFKVEEGKPEEILEEMKKNLEYRKKAHPSGKSAGSVFKNPPGKKAWELIDMAGLRGRCVGGACVSTKHANFIINKGNATALDIYMLIKEIQETVYKKFGVFLELEVELLGEF